MVEELIHGPETPSLRRPFLKYAPICVTVALIALALLLGASAYGDVRLRQALQRDGVRVQGVITGTEGRTGDTIDFRFSTTDGRVIEGSYGSYLCFPERPYLTRNVDVVYDLRDPARAIPAPFSIVPRCGAWSQLVDSLEAIVLAVAVGLAFALAAAIQQRRDAAETRFA